MINIHAPGGDFMLPYINRAIAGIADDIDADVMISSTGIYIPGEGWLDEDCPTDTSSPWVALEDEFRNSTAGRKAFILRCAPVIGTGMNGSLRRLAEEIYRGFFFHFPGNEARLSIVHACDVGRAVAFLVAGDAQPGVYNLTDGVDHTLHDIAEAIAFRMGNKRISNLSTKPQQMIGRWLYGKERYRRYTTTSLFSSVKLRSLGFEPRDTCHYMKTHVYDENSL